MATRVVDKVRTPLTISDMMSIGALSYTDVFGSMAPTYVLATAASQWTTECGIQPGTNKSDGSKVIWNIWNNNWGNITTKADSDTDKHALTTKERIIRGVTPDLDIWKTITMYYKSYAQPIDGAKDYWVKMKQSYSKSFKTFETGNTKLIAQTLSDERYYTDLVEKYESNLKYFFPRYVRLLTTGSES